MFTKLILACIAEGLFSLLLELNAAQISTAVHSKRSYKVPELGLGSIWGEDVVDLQHREKSVQLLVFNI